MKFYEKYFASNYDELITYYPRFYREVFEMVEILKAHGRIADELEDNIEQAYLNSFIDYADEATITKLEKFLMIGLNKSRSLEERRRLVKSYFVGFGKVSASMLEEMITSYTNAPVKSRFEPCDEEGNNQLYIEFERGKEPTLYMSDINLLLGKKIPAHISWQAAIVYKFAVGVGRKRNYHKYGYELTGTKPDTALLGLNIIRDSVTKEKHRSELINHRAASEGEATGLYPDTALLGFNYIRESITQERHETSSYNQRQADEESELTGTYPEATLLGQSITRQTGAGADVKSYTTEYKLSGKVPETIILGRNNDIDAATEVTATEYSVDYIPCGTTFTQ